MMEITGDSLDWENITENISILNWYTETSLPSLPLLPSHSISQGLEAEISNKLEGFITCLALPISCWVRHKTSLCFIAFLLRQYWYYSFFFPSPFISLAWLPNRSVTQINEILLVTFLWEKAKPNYTGKTFLFNRAFMPTQWVSSEEGMRNCLEHMILENSIMHMVSWLFCL